MTLQELEHLGYRNTTISNNYFTAMPAPGIGVMVAIIASGCFLQFFPWKDAELASGHKFYADFISDKATTTLAENQQLFHLWPHIHIEQFDLLMVKCAIEDGLKQTGHMNRDTDQRR